MSRSPGVSPVASARPQRGLSPGPSRRVRGLRRIPFMAFDKDESEYLGQEISRHKGQVSGGEKVGEGRVKISPESFLRGSGAGETKRDKETLYRKWNHLYDRHRIMWMGRDGWVAFCVAWSGGGGGAKILWGCGGISHTPGFVIYANVTLFQH